MSDLKKIWSDAVLLKTASIKEVIQNLTETSFKISIVANDIGEFEGTVSDGDIRRALLKGLELESPIENIVNRNAFVVTPKLERDLVLQLMIANKIQQIPIVDDENKMTRIFLVVC